MAEKMTDEDRRILRALAQLGPSSVKETAQHLGYVGHTTSTGWRLRAMLGRGLTKRPDYNKYDISEAGRRALDEASHG